MNQPNSSILGALLLDSKKEIKIIQYKIKPNRKFAPFRIESFADLKPRITTVASIEKEAANPKSRLIDEDNPLENPSKITLDQCIPLAPPILRLRIK
jgi:hypothetical protein